MDIDNFEDQPSSPFKLKSEVTPEAETEKENIDPEPTKRFENPSESLKIKKKSMTTMTKTIQMTILFIRENPEQQWLRKPGGYGFSCQGQPITFISNFQTSLYQIF